MCVFFAQNILVSVRTGFITDTLTQNHADKHEIFTNQFEP